MHSAGWQWATKEDRGTVITICPNTVLGAVILTSLVFVSYLGRHGALVFLLAGLVLMARRPGRTMGELRDDWHLNLLPLWCIVSVFWSEHPDLSLRHGVQLALTFMIATTLANRLAPIRFLHILFAALMIAGLASILIGNVRHDGVWIGIFESKNYYAFTMATLLLCSFAFLVDRQVTARWRILGFLGVLLALPQVVMAQSVGAVIASAFVLGVAMLLLGVHGLPPARRKGRLLLIGLLALLSLASALHFRTEIFDLVVQITGKDPSLTGRTQLWAAAFDEIERAPLLGIGYRAFWVEGNALAEALWADFYIPSKSGFNFHSLYLSNAVEIGLVGVVLQIILLVPALFLSGRWLVRSGGTAALFCFMVVAFVIVLSFIEVPVFFEFHALSVTVMASLVFGLRAAREIPGSRQMDMRPYSP